MEVDLCELLLSMKLGQPGKPVRYHALSVYTLFDISRRQASPRGDGQTLLFAVDSEDSSMPEVPSSHVHIHECLHSLF
jgi:hypothetical protein